MAIKKIRNFKEQEDDFIHSPFFPAQVREEDRISVIVSRNGQENEFSVYEYSPFGLGFLGSGDDYGKGDKISLKVKIGNSLIDYDGLVVGRIDERQGQSKIGIRTFTKVKRENVEVDERKTKRWTCPKMSLPTGTAPSPKDYNDHIFFRVDDISAGGMLLRMSMRNKFVHRGMRLSANISLPMVGDVHTTFIVRHVNVRDSGGKMDMLVGVKFLDKDDVLNASLAEYILTFAQNVSLNSLIKDGFKVKRVSKLLDFSYVKSEKDYEDVINLRFDSYKSIGNMKEGATPEDMSDEFDTTSRILMVKHQGKLVGSLRFSFYDRLEDMSIGRYAHFPEDFPSAKELVEVSRACINYGSRGADILENFIVHSVLTTIKSGRRYLVAGSTKRLMNYYLDCGFEDTGVKYTNEALGGAEHSLIKMDTHSIAFGKNIKLKSWCKIYGSLVDYLLEQEIISPSKMELMKINSYKKLGKVLGYI